MTDIVCFPNDSCVPLERIPKLTFHKCIPLWCSIIKDGFIDVVRDNEL